MRNAFGHPEFERTLETTLNDGLLENAFGADPEFDSAPGDVIVNVEEFVLTGFNDVFVGGNGNEIVDGGAAPRDADLADLHVASVSVHGERFHALNECGMASFETPSRSNRRQPWRRLAQSGRFTSSVAVHQQAPTGTESRDA
jgi:hypothetical protein